MIKWTPVKIKLRELKPWKSNPRYSKKTQAVRILKSIEEFGQAEHINISPSGNVYNGHQRLSALLQEHGEDYIIDALQSDIEFTEEQKARFTLALHNATGLWDWDTLSGWEDMALTEWGFDEETLREWMTDVSALGNLVDSTRPIPEDEPESDMTHILISGTVEDLDEVKQLIDLIAEYSRIKVSYGDYKNSNLKKMLRNKK